MGSNDKETSIDQIAAEAAAQIFGLSDENRTKWAKRIIKSAIEKAWQDGYVEGSNYQISISRVAHASEDLCRRLHGQSQWRSEPAHASEQK